MPVKTNDDFTFGRFDSNVHRIGHNLIGIVQQMNERILLLITRDDSPGFISTHSINEQDLQILFGIILSNDRIDTL